MEFEENQRSSFFPALMGAIIGGLIVGGFTLWLGGGGGSTPEAVTASVYDGMVRTHVSPVEVRGWIENGNADHVIVDVRAAEDYARGHIVTSVNIPASTLTPELLVEAFKKLPEGKTPVLYCYSAACMLAPKTADTLAKRSVFVKVMTIGWNEWRYDWKMWNGQRVTTDPLQYSAVGTEPGTYAGPKITEGCSVSAGEGC